jgi:hypothetical protein
VWTRTIGYGGAAVIRSSCTDTSGNLYVAGRFDGTVNFAKDWQGFDEKTGFCEAFITKIGSDGSYCWTHRFGDWKIDIAFGVCVDTSGGLYVTGEFRDTVNFAEDWSDTDIKVSQDGTDIFITKLTTDGDYCWTRTAGGQGHDHAYAVCTDSAGNVYMTGTFGEVVNFAADWGGSDVKTGTVSVYVTKIDADGSYCWTRMIGDSHGNLACTMCTDSNDNVYVGGEFNANPPDGTINFAADWGMNDTVQSYCSPQGFLTKIMANGDYGWTKVLASGDLETSRVSGLCGICNAGLFMTAWKAGKALVAFIDPATGVALWERAFGETRDELTPLCICSDDNSCVYVSGSFKDDANFGRSWGLDCTRSSAGENDAFIGKLNSRGGYRWVHTIGGIDEDIAYSICSDNTGNIYVAGSFGYSWWLAPYCVDFGKDWGLEDYKSSLDGHEQAFIIKLGKQ